MLVIVATSAAVISSCSKDDDNNTTSVSLSQSEIIGTWEITSVSGSSSWSWIAVGKTLTFNSDYSCKTSFSMEDSYKIENGSIHTYYKKTIEPMLIYTATAKDNSNYTIKVQGTLDESNQSVMIKMVKK